jgi:Ca2+-transporting ATPase
MTQAPTIAGHAAGEAWHSQSAGDVMKRPPRQRSERITDRGFLRTMAFAVLVFAELLRSFGARSETKPVWRISLSTNVSLVIVAVSFGLQTWSQHNATPGRFLKTAPMSFADCRWLPALGAIPLVVLELAEMLRHSARQPSPDPKVRT